MSTEILIILPILIPLLNAVISLFLWNHPRWQRIISVAGTAFHLVAAIVLLRSIQYQGIQSVQIGGWQAPFGITLVIDLFSAIMLLVTALIGLAVAVYSWANIDTDRVKFGYFPLYHILLMGISGAFLTGDLFNLYVWFEVMLIASFVLTALGGEPDQLEGALKYVTLNLLSSAVFLATVGIIYGLTGTLNMADLATLMPHVDSGIANTLAMMFLIAFGLKAAIFPLYFWLPAAYHTPPAAISAIFAGLLTKVGVYALVRVFTLIFVKELVFTHTVLLVLAALTMLTGILGAISQRDFRRILAFNLISHVGFMLLGLALYTPLALAGMILYTIHHMLVKTSLFLSSGLVYRLRGTYHLPSLGGLYRSNPIVALLFFIPAIALAGLPPLSGFWPKLALFQAGLNNGQYLVIGVVVLMSLLTLYSMIKIWFHAFWKPIPDGETVEQTNKTSSWNLMVAPVFMLTLFILILGLIPEPVLQLSQTAANQLLAPTEYMNIVLGGGN